MQRIKEAFDVSSLGQPCDVLEVTRRSCCLIAVRTRLLLVVVLKQFLMPAREIKLQWVGGSSLSHVALHTVFCLFLSAECQCGGARKDRQTDAGNGWNREQM